MSVTTSKRLNRDKFVAQLPGIGAFSVTGAQLEDAAEKIITAEGFTDQQLTAAVDAAAAVFVDYNSNLDALQAKAVTALTTNATYLGHAAVPAGTLTLAQLSTIVRLLADQLDATTRQNTALIRLAANQLDSTSGT